MNAPVPLRDLRFGHLDASQEAAEDPDLLREGYYDYREAAYAVASGSAFVLLGPKGSGKSAVLEHLRLRWADQWDHFLQRWDLRGFPVSDVTQIKMGQSPGSSRNQAAWELLLLLKIYESLSEDQGVQPAGDVERIVDWLRGQGLLTPNWAASVSKWTASEFKLDLKIVSATWGTQGPSNALEASAFLRDKLVYLRTDSRHVIAIDGLDSFFFELDDEWASLGGLMQALLSLNLHMRECGLRITVVAALRSDIFDLLPGGENNKLKPNAVHLDWHAHGIGRDNHLWRLLTEKVRVHRPEVTNLVSHYLSRPISIGPHTEMTTYLLEHTRLLPRDAVALMSYLQRCYGGIKSVPEDNAKEAVRRYCEEYFVGEIFDNLSGVVDTVTPRKMAAFKDALRSVPAKIFGLSDLETELDGALDKSEVRDLLRQMFKTGGIGIFNRNAGYIDFVFRKVSGAAFTTSREFVLHEALVKAWNRPHRTYD
ncbi:P-loop ATPase, Sll1717 family [Nocardioides zeae]|uniref:Uncharacterized protein n=1 Tax=Nocardioides zeae TaxID=1457234 RepID=A0AAJ1U2M0_9ACTN|nr:hypothetical protein [Nocardioides zeae]MDQ1104820.1 hypothetical protein [Nocardioides zeae]